jgi:hypothetical protein
MPNAAPPSPVTTAWWTANGQQQVVAQLATGSIPAAATPGRMYADTTLTRYVYDTGSALVPGAPWTSSGRVGVSLARLATQSIATGTSTFTAISWDTEITDTDGFIAVPSGSITIPSGLGGIYGILLNVAWASSPGANSSVEILVGATAWRFPIGAGTQLTSVALSVTQALAATNVVQFRLSQGSGGAINVTGTVQMWRLSA